MEEQLHAGQNENLRLLDRALEYIRESAKATFEEMTEVKIRLSAALDREIMERDDAEASRQTRDVVNRAREKALADLRVAEEENDRFREQCVNFQGRVNEQTERIAELEEVELQMRGQIALMHADLEAAKGREIEMAGQMVVVEVELEEMKGRMPLVEAELEGFKVRMPLVEAELATAKGRETELTGQLAGVEAELAQVREREAAITAELALVQERVTELERNEAAAKHQTETLKTELKEKDQRITALGKDIENEKQRQQSNNKAHMMLQCMFPLMKDYFNTSDVSSSVGSESGDSSVSTIFTPSPVREAGPPSGAGGGSTSGSEAGGLASGSEAEALASGPDTYHKPEDYTVTDQDGDLWLTYPTHTRVRFRLNTGELMNAEVKAWKNLKNSDFSDDNDRPMEVWRCTYTQVPDSWVSPVNLLAREVARLHKSADFVCCACIFEQIDFCKEQLENYAEQYQVWIRGGGHEGRHQNLELYDFIIESDSLPEAANGIQGTYICQGYEQGSALWHNSDVGNVDCARVWLDDDLHWNIGSVEQYENFDPKPFCRSATARHDKPYECLFWKFADTPGGWMNFIHLEQCENYSEDEEEAGGGVGVSGSGASGASGARGASGTSGTSGASGSGASGASGASGVRASGGAGISTAPENPMTSKRPRQPTNRTQASYTERGGLSRPSGSKKRTHPEDGNDGGGKKGGKKKK